MGVIGVESHEKKFVFNRLDRLERRARAIEVGFYVFLLLLLVNAFIWIYR